MPSFKQVESLKQMCFLFLAKDIHKISVDLEVSDSPNYMKRTDLLALIASLPCLFVEQMIAKVIETIHKTIKSSRRTIGLQTCLEVLLQPNILRLDLSGLFFKMRLPVQINSTIRRVVCQKVVSMKNLTCINLASKCNDEILLAISENCENILEIIINISDLVTDKGINYIARRCHNLERLDIYKCWGISLKGVKSALIHLKNLREIHWDGLGSVFLKYLKDTKNVFKLSHFEQTCTLFEPNVDEASWIGTVCPDIQSVRLAIDDKYLPCLPKLGQLRNVELELSSVAEEGFKSAIPQISSTLTLLHLSCEILHQNQITLIGQACIHLTSFHLITASITDDKELKNAGQYFANLTSLHLQIWKESFIRVECIDFFLLWCYKLDHIVIKAQMDFFTDDYLQRVLFINPFSHAIKVMISSDTYVPLTKRSIEKLIDQCSDLEVLSVSSWDVSEEEFFHFSTLIQNNNYNLLIT